MTYKRSKTDSALYCPYCGHGFTMNRDRYYATYRAFERGGTWAFALTTCKTCKKEFLFRNITPDTVRKYGIRAVIKIEERGKYEKSNTV